jgi:hypothetical protein
MTTVGYRVRGVDAEGNVFWLAMKGGVSRDQAEALVFCSLNAARRQALDQNRLGTSGLRFMVPVPEEMS